MTLEEIKQLDQYVANRIEQLERLDGEDGHKKADDELCTLLQQLGFTKTVKQFCKLERWYS